MAYDDHVLDQPIILDEVQKVPQIRDEVHWQIENKGLCFLLCGSSARKLKRDRDPQAGSDPGRTAKDGRWLIDDLHVTDEELEPEETSL